MPLTASLDEQSRAALEDELMQVEGVVHAAVDSRTDSIWVVRDSDHEPAPLELALRNRLAALGHDPAGVTVRITLPAAAGPRRRVRFVAVERQEDHGLVTVTVHLEWDGTTFQGRASGDKGPAIELKTSAFAAIDAIQKLSGQDFKLRVIGVKAIHAFDSELMVASLLRTDGQATRLVGAVLVADDPIAAAAVAVLSALNRTLGNFLHTSD